MPQFCVREIEKFVFNMRSNGNELLVKYRDFPLGVNGKERGVCVIFSLCFQAFFTEKYLQEHPEDQDKIELLKHLIALQVLYWERSTLAVCERRCVPASLFGRDNADKCCKNNLDSCCFSF